MPISLLGTKLGLDSSEVDALFDEWDTDKSGAIAISELNTMLRKRVELDPNLKVGAAGEIELDRDQSIALRKGKVNKMDSNILQGLDLIEDGKPVHEQVWAPLPCPAVRQLAGARRAMVLIQGSARAASCCLELRRSACRRLRTRSR